MNERVTIGDLVREPGRAATVPLDAVPDLLADVARVQGLLLARLVSANGSSLPSAALSVNGDTNLSVTKAARRLGVSPSYLYRHAPRLPFTVRIGRKLLFSAEGLERWNRRRQGCQR